jgi:hypothetical protein
MGYKRITKLWPLAVSVSDAGRVLGVAKSVIERALSDGVFECRVPPHGMKRPRILTEDLVRFVREHWKLV